MPPVDCCQTTFEADDILQAAEVSNYSESQYWLEVIANAIQFLFSRHKVDSEGDVSFLTEQLIDISSKVTYMSSKTIFTMGPI